MTNTVAASLSTNVATRVLVPNRTCLVSFENDFSPLLIMDAAARNVFFSNWEIGVAFWWTFLSMLVTPFQPLFFFAAAVFSSS